MNTLIISLIIFVVIITISLFIYFFWWRKSEHPKVQKAISNIKQLKDKLPFGNKTNKLTKEAKDVKQNNETKEGNETKTKTKWQSFNENKKFNFEKIKRDITINNSHKIDDADFKEIFNKPYETKDEKLFELDSYTKTKSSVTSYDSLIENINPIDETIINLDSLNDIDNFTTHYKNINEPKTTTKKNFSLKEHLIKTELF